VKGRPLVPEPVKYDKRNQEELGLVGPYGESVARLAALLAKLPGIGQKTAERLADHIVRLSTQEALELAQAIREVKESVRQCSVCFLLSEGDPCRICADSGRDRSVICVVEDSRDAAAIETSGCYRGLYHVLGGRLAPLEGMEPEHLTVSRLLERVTELGIKEVILATNPDMEGDATALFVQDALVGLPVRVTRLARGVPSGSHLEFANAAILSDAMEGRREMAR